jgi:hypothetical protein
VWTLRAFIGSICPQIEPTLREAIGRVIHETYRIERARDASRAELSMAEWENLPATLRNSNLQQADHILEKLRQIGCVVEPVEGRPVNLIEFSAAEVEVLAEMEHARWNVERLLDGWKWGAEKDVSRKLSPYLVSWAELPDDIRELDRQTVRRIPGYLAGVGLEIHRQSEP